MGVKVYTINELMSVKIKHVPIIEKILKVGDLMVVKAQSKTGKSVFTQQIAHAVSSGEDFLHAFPTRKGKVVYVSGEGYIADWQDRFDNMGKMWKVDDDNLRFLECTDIALHTKTGKNMVVESLLQCWNEIDLVIFDNLGSLIEGGSINDQTHMSTFMGNLNSIRSMFNCAIVLVHHDSEKAFTDKSGKKHMAHHTTLMGSTFTGAGMTHAYTLMKTGHKKGEIMHRIVLGKTRSGYPLEKLDMYMITPENDQDNRLGYTLDHGDFNKNYHLIKSYIHDYKEVSDHKPFEDIGVSESTFYRQVAQLIQQGFVAKIKKEKKGYYTWTSKK